MNYINSNYKLFESEINDIIEKCKIYDIRIYEIDDEGLLTVYEDVNLRDKSLKEMPLKFKEVHGNFNISENNITSLYGSPLIVTGGFFASNTNIKDLKYAPIEVGDDFYLGDNEKLINLIHFPKYVGGDVTLWGCGKLKSLYGCLKFLNGDIYLDWCYDLNTLKYSPLKVIGSYTCESCNLKSLFGAPKYVGDSFSCSINKLSSLKYSPKYIGKNFYFYDNNITSFDYFPDYVGGEINCYNNPVYNVWRLFEDNEFVDYFNQMKIISDDGKKINIKRLNVFLNSIGKDYVKSVEGYENI